VLNLLGEGALDKHVSHGFQMLIIEQISGVMLEPVPREPLRGPATILYGKLGEKIHFWWRPVLPDVLLGRDRMSSHGMCHVGGPCRILTVGCPLPKKTIKFIA
jgi:hypothetical protein